MVVAKAELPNPDSESGEPLKKLKIRLNNIKVVKIKVIKDKSLKNYDIVDKAQKLKEEKVAEGIQNIFEWVSMYFNVINNSSQKAGQR